MKTPPWHLLLLLLLALLFHSGIKAQGLGFKIENLDSIGSSVVLNVENTVTGEMLGEYRPSKSESFMLRLPAGSFRVSITKEGYYTRCFELELIVADMRDTLVRNTLIDLRMLKRGPASTLTAEGILCCKLVYSPETFDFHWAEGTKGDCFETLLLLGCKPK